jgi:hypothetical protein
MRRLSYRMDKTGLSPHTVIAASQPQASRPAAPFAVWKLLIGVGTTIFLVLGAPYAAIRLGLIAPFADKAWLILAVTVTGLIAKNVLGDIVAGEFLFYKFGYDNCVMTFGAVLTALALQLVSTVDLFPGFSNVAIIGSLPMLSYDPILGRSLQLLLLLFIAFSATLITGRIAVAIKHEKARGPHFLSLLNSLVGVLLLGLYVLVLITKG